MANISKINVNNNEYNIKDAVARGALGTLTGSNAVPTALNNKVGYADYRTVTESGATKHYIYFYKNDSDAPTNASTIPSTYLCKIDAAPFIKDGMITSVAISNGNLVITWNSDSTGVTTPTTIPLTDIFDPDNYYDKDTIDGMIEDIEAGQVQIADNLTTQDATKALSANQGYVLNTNKANKNELSITAVTGKTDRKNVQLKSGTSQEFLIAHQTWSDVLPTGGIPATDLAGSIPTSKITGLATVATSGSYNDLSNKPTIPAAPGTLNTSLTTAQSTSTNEALSGTIKLHKVAKTGTYSDLIGAPTNVSSFTNDSGYQTSSQVSSAISAAVSGSYTASTETLSLTLPTFTTA